MLNPLFINYLSKTSNDKKSQSRLSLLLMNKLFGRIWLTPTFCLYFCSQVGLIWNHLYDTQSLFRFLCVCTFIQVVHIEFLKVAHTAYSTFSLQQSESETSYTCSNFRKKKVKEKEKKRKVWVKRWLKGRGPQDYMKLFLQNGDWKANIIIKIIQE